MGRRILRAGFLIFMIFGIAFAQEEAKPKENAQEKQEKPEKLVSHTSQIKEVLGEVTWVGKEYLSVTYNSDAQSGIEYEMLLPYDKKNVILEHKRNLGEINKGDTIRIKYEEELKDYDSGRQEVKRKGRVISFVRAAAKKPATPITDSGAQQ